MHRIINISAGLFLSAAVSASAMADTITTVSYTHLRAHETR